MFSTLTSDQGGKNPLWLWISQRINFRILYVTGRALSYQALTFLSGLTNCLPDLMPNLWPIELLAVFISVSFRVLSFASCCSLCLQCCGSLSSLANSYRSFQTTQKCLLGKTLPLYLQAGVGASALCLVPHGRHHVMVPAC